MSRRGVVRKRLDFPAGDDPAAPLYEPLPPSPRRRVGQEDVRGFPPFRPKYWIPARHPHSEKKYFTVADKYSGYSGATSTPFYRFLNLGPLIESGYADGQRIGDRICCTNLNLRGLISYNFNYIYDYPLAEPDAQSFVALPIDQTVRVVIAYDRQPNPNDPDDTPPLNTVLQAGVDIGPIAGDEVPFFNFRENGYVSRFEILHDEVFLVRARPVIIPLSSIGSGEPVVTVCSKANVFGVANIPFDIALFLDKSLDYSAASPYPTVGNIIVYILPLLSDEDTDYIVRTTVVALSTRLKFYDD